MKKLLGSTLALAMFLPAGANAELLKNLKVGGQLDVQATSAQNVTDFVTGLTSPTSLPASSGGQDHIGSAYTRTMLKVDWDLLDDVHSHISLTKGSNSNASQGPRGYGAGAETADTVQTSILVTEANVKIDKLFGFADTTIGRQFYGNPGDAVVYYGPHDNYGLGVSAIDAFRFDWNGEKFGLTGIAGKIDTTLVGYMGTNKASVDLRGLVANLKVNENASGSAYVYNKETHATNLGSAPSGKNDFLWIVGVKGKANVAGLALGGEIAKNLGQNRVTGGAGAPGDPQDYAYSGWMMMLNAAYKLDLANVGAINPWGEFAFGSGRSRTDTNHNDGWTDIHSDYRPGGIYGRFAGQDAIEKVGSAVDTGIAQAGLSNRTIYGFGVKGTPTALPKLTAGVQWYHYAFSRTSTFTTPAAIGQYPRSIGTETDLTAEWKHSENVGLKLTLGSFQPGAYVYSKRGANAAVKPATMAALDTTIRF